MMPQPRGNLDRLELKVPPVLVWLVCAVAILACGKGLTSLNAHFAGQRAAGVVLALAGFFIALAGVLQFRIARTTVNPMRPEAASAVVDSGIFRWTRNPMYLGLACVLGSEALWWGTVPGLFCVFAFCAWIGRFQIRPEERALQGLFGADYSRYTERVRRWL